jgi:repressor LexA
MKPTESQQRVLDYIKRHLEERGQSPSVLEICAGLGLKSHGSLIKHLRALESLGLLEHTPGRTRSWMPVGWSPGAGARAGIPLLGRIAAGTPILAQEDREEELPMDPAMFGSRDCLALRVRGDSMIGAGILNGDIAVIEPGEGAEPGSIVAVLVGGLEAEATLKRYRDDGRIIRLEAANPEIPDLVFKGEDRERVRVVGRLKGVIRSLAH